MKEFISVQGECFKFTLFTFMGSHYIVLFLFSLTYVQFHHGTGNLPTQFGKYYL